MGANSITWLVSPKLAPWQKKVLKDIVKRVPSSSSEGETVWVLSSGTQSVNEVKCIGLSREAVEASARAVNAHLKATSRDRWLIAIPEYHVGGYAIRVRATLSKSRVFVLSGAWSAKKFVNSVLKNKITLSSLVPTQIFDLVNQGARAPKCLRAIVVGGGALDEHLYLRARQLGWPVLPSYGLTETASQVATASLSSLKKMAFPALQVLPHARLQMRQGNLWVKAESLCHLVAKATREGVFTLEEPSRDGWLKTEDIAEQTVGGWRILGRGDDVVKVLGVLVPIVQVESEIRAVFLDKDVTGDLTVLARPSEREGNELCLITNSKWPLRTLVEVLESYNSQTSGPQRIKKLVWTPQIPRNEMGKIKKATLREWLG